MPKIHRPHFCGVLLNGGNRSGSWCHAGEGVAAVRRTPDDINNLHTLKFRRRRRGSNWRGWRHPIEQYFIGELTSIRPPRRLPIARRSVYVPSDHWQNVSFGICPLRREVWISLVVASKSRVHHSVWRRHVCAALSSLPLLKRCLLASLVLSSKKLFGAVIFVRRHVSH